MTAPAPMGHEDLDEVAAHLKLSIRASELHGSLCGLLAANSRPGRRSMLSVLHLNPGRGSLSDDDQGVLDRVVRQSEKALADPELSFDLLLPADDRPLPERAGALVDWCRGFLGGFGLGGPGVHGRLSDQGQEIMRDIGLIAAGSFEVGGDEEDEDALIEVHEFVRMGVMLLFTECHIPSSSGKAL